MTTIIPAILTQDEDIFTETMNLLSQKEGLWVQVDIMDGIFVQQTSIPLPDMKKWPNIQAEAHLMIQEPQKLFADCKEKGYKRVIVHIEAVSDAQNIIQQLHNEELEAGIAINPETEARELQYLKENPPEVFLVLGVHPGKQGQVFLESTLEKIKDVQKMFPNTPIAIDGGVKLDNMKSMMKAGATRLSVGSAIVKAQNPLQTYDTFVQKAKA